MGLLNIVVKERPNATLPVSKPVIGLDAESNSNLLSSKVLYLIPTNITIQSQLSLFGHKPYQILPRVSRCVL